MATRTFILSDAQTAVLRQAYERTKDGPSRTRSQAVRLYGMSYPVPQVQEITGCSRTRLLDRCRLYRLHGVPGLVNGRMGGHRAKLTQEQRQTVRTYLHQYPPRQLFGADTATPASAYWTVPDRTRAVQHGFGVAWNSHRSYLARLADCEFTYQRPQKGFKSRREHEIVAGEAQREKN